MSIKELFAVLYDEITEAQETMTAALVILQTHSQEEETYQQAFENYAEQLIRITETIEMLEITGLKILCDKVSENLGEIFAVASDDILFDLLKTWPELLLQYLKKPTQYAKDLVAYFQNTNWPNPLEGEQAQTIIESLTHIQQAEIITEKKPQTISKIDINLAFAQDINQQLIHSFLMEAPTHTSHYASVIQKAIKNTKDFSTLDEARRTIHTLKGAANTVGVKGIANLSHYTEDLLQYLVQESIFPNKNLSNLLIRIADCLEAMVGSLLGQEPEPSNSFALLQEIFEWNQKINEIDIQAFQDTQTNEIKEENQPTLEKNTKTPNAQTLSFLPISTQVIDNMIKVSGEITISQSQVQNQIYQITDQIKSLQQQNILLHQKTFAFENLIDTQSHSTTHYKDFDNLEMDRYNEVHSYTHAFIEAFADFNLLTKQLEHIVETLNYRFSEQKKLQNNLQNHLLQSRMLPAKEIESRLQRAVRHACSVTEKEVNLTITGQDVLIDSYVLQEIAEPLMHLLRNAIDHGIEEASIRLEKNKPEQGNINLSFAKEGNKIIIRCQDDGKGLNFDKIRAKAIEQGILSSDQNISDKDLAEYILQPGFSTAKNITQLSGRGIGLDVVYAKVLELKGQIDIYSQIDKGVLFTLKLPLTLTAIQVLIVKVSQYLVAIPIDNILQIFHTSTIKKINEQWFFQTGKQTYPVKLLAELINYPIQTLLSEQENRAIVLIDLGLQKHIALVIDEVLDIDEVIIKKAGKYFSNLPGVTGITILGNGNVIPVIDINTLWQRFDKKTLTTPTQILQQPIVQDYLLVVDDSFSVRQALTQLLKDAGYQVKTAKDGIEALEAINQQWPKALLIDLEMPRMNGLEVTEHIRRQDTSLPIIMITSRSQDKHKNRAFSVGVDEYITKPYQEITLLETLHKYV